MGDNARMGPPLLVSGLDVRSLLLEAPLLRRDRHAIEERASGRELVESIALLSPRLVVLGPRLPDLSLDALVRRIRSSPTTRQVSVLVLLPRAEGQEAEASLARAGANAVLRRPLDPARLEGWIAKLMAVPRRIQARLPVEAEVVGTPQGSAGGHFFGQTRNVSVAGMLLASPVRLSDAPELELEFELPGSPGRLRALGRVVREAPEVGWPYLGYGVEFFFLPPETQDAVAEAVARVSEGVPAGEPPIHSTLRREGWVYEIREPRRRGEGWQAEIRRAAQETWRPGEAGPFYVVDGASREQTLDRAREFVRLRG